jgi:hypothetical protein
VLGGKKAGEPSERHDLMTLDMPRGRDRVGHPPGHSREGARSLAELLGGVFVEFTALCVSLEGVIA